MVFLYSLFTDINSNCLFFHVSYLVLYLFLITYVDYSDGNPFFLGKKNGWYVFSPEMNNSVVWSKDRETRKKIKKECDL